LGLPVLALKTVKNHEVILKKLHPAWALLQAAEIAGTITTGGSGNFSFPMFQ